MPAKIDKVVHPPPSFADALDEATECVSAAIGHLDDAKGLAIAARGRNPAMRIQAMQAILKSLMRELINLHPTEQTP